MSVIIGLIFISTFLATYLIASRQSFTFQEVNYGDYTVEQLRTY